MIKRIIRSTFSIIFIVLLLIGQSFATTQILPEFESYYNKFINHLNKQCTQDQIHAYRRINNLTINFGDLKKQHYAGVTHSQLFRYTSDSKNRDYYDILIQIDMVNWAQAPDEEKVALIYHELFHAYFDYPDLKDKKYAYHLMYYTTRYISMDEVERQVVELFDILCGKK